MTEGSPPSRARPPAAVRRTQLSMAGHLKTWRKLRGLTQAELADRANVDRRIVMRIEAGEGPVQVEQLIRVLRGLGLLDTLATALDPYESDVGRLRADEQQPTRVRRKKLTGD